MKKQFVFALAMITLARACGPQSDKAAELEKLIKKEQELTTQKDQIDAELRALTVEISKLREELDTAKTDASVAVVLEELSAGKFTHILDIQGVVTSDNNVTLSAENGGKVLRIHVKEGQRVSKGQKLVDLDGSILQSNINEVKTRLVLAEETYQKQENLFKQKIGTEMQYLQAKNNYEALKDQLNTLYTQLDKFNLKAPFDGTVDEVFVKAGELTSPGMPAIRVVNLKEIEVSADVSEKYVGAFKSGDPVRIYFPAIKDTINARISAIGQVINAANRTFKMTIDINSNDERLKPNLLAIIHASDFEKEQAITVPANLIQTIGTRKFIKVAVEKNGKWFADERDVQTGLSSKGRIYIESGLNAGDRIITQGYLNVEKGDELKTK